MAEGVENPKSVAYNEWSLTNLRLPGADGGTQIVPNAPRAVTTRIVLKHQDPTSEAANWVANTPNGGSMKQLQQELVQGGYLDPTDLPAVPGTRNQATETALRNAMDDANNSGAYWRDQAKTRAAQIAAGLIPGSKKTGGGGGTAGTVQLTGPVSARNTFDQLSRKYTGQKSTDAEFADAYAKLVDAQTKAPIKYTTQKINGRNYTVQVSDGVKAEDFLEQYIFSKVNFGSDEIGGAIGDTLNSVRQIGKLYGSKISTAESGQFAKGILDGSMTAEGIKKVFADRAKAKYKAIADRVSESVSVFDLVSDYIAQKANVLELDADTMSIDDVEEAISGDSLMNMSEFITKQKKDPRYQYTTQARTEAASFATNLASVFRTGV
jgi:hypothetical protein